MIDEKLLKDIESYCNINCLDTKEFINNILKKGFMVEKYGNRPGVQIQTNLNNVDKQNIEDTLNVKKDEFEKVVEINVENNQVFEEKKEIKKKVRKLN